MSMIQTIYALARHDVAASDLLNSELERSHGLRGFVREKSKSGPEIVGDLVIPAAALRMLLVDAFKEGHEAAHLGARVEELIEQTAALAAASVCDHESPRKASSGIDALACGDCGQFVGRRR